MGVGYNLLNGGSVVSPNIFVTLSEPSATSGLWIKTDIVPSYIKSVFKSDIEPQFASSWTTTTLPEGYTTFAIVGDNIYLFGNSATYQKANLLEEPYNFTSYNSGNTSLFTNSAVIGNKIYATKDGSTLQVYEMDTTAETPVFQMLLPEYAAFSNPKICSYGSKIYALKGATPSTQTVVVLDTSDANPSWTALSSLYEDTTKTNIIVNNGFLYAIGVYTGGSKCYSLDLSNSTNLWQLATGFLNQGTSYAALSSVGNIVRIVNSGYATSDRNSLSLIGGVWRTASQTGFTLLTVNSNSYTHAYETNYGLYVKDKMNTNLYKLSRNRPILNLPDNSILIVKGESNNRPQIATLGNYSLRESIIECYHLSVIEGNEVLTNIPIAYYDELEEDWIDI